MGDADMPEEDRQREKARPGWSIATKAACEMMLSDCSPR